MIVGGGELVAPHVETLIIVYLEAARVAQNLNPRHRLNHLLLLRLRLRL